MKTYRMRGTMKTLCRVSAMGLPLGVALIAGCGMNDQESSLSTEDAALKFHRSAEPVSDRYIVMLKEPGQGSGGPGAMALAPNVAALSDELGASYDADIRSRYPAVRGFAAAMSERDALALAADPRVKLVAEDGVVRASEIQSPATWGLDRVDQRFLPLDNSFEYKTEAETVTAYVVDTGINIGHNEFGGRATHGTSTVGGTPEDCNGHGTHVAGTIGGATYGLAKSVNLVAVRVLDCGGSGTWEGVIGGIDWVTDHHSGPSVANMSLGGGVNAAVNAAVARSTDAGVTYAVAAGNDSWDACQYSPASAPSAITVGSTTSSDTRSYFSNYGTCVDIFAPGSDITSAWIGSNSATNTISGTSMATPHVAGAVALYLASHPTATPAQVSEAFSDDSTVGVVVDPGAGSPNKFLYALIDGSPPPDTDPPTVAITAPADGSTVAMQVQVTATAADTDGTVARVRFELPGVGVVDDTTAPYEATWDTTAVANGNHVVRARAFDNLGAVSETSAVTVTVFNDGCDERFTTTEGMFQSPNYPDLYPVSYERTWCIQPANGYDATLVFDPFNTEQGYDYVQITDGNTGVVLSNTSGTVPPPPATSSFLIVRFTSDYIIARTGFQATWTSGPHNEPPTAEITAPASGSTVNGTVTIAASATDSDGSIAKVRFTMPNGAVVEDTTAPYEAPFDTTPLFNGGYAFQAVAIDNLGAQSLPSTVFVTVFNVACDETLTAQSGTLQSPNFPDNYPVNYVRTWCIKPANGTAATLAFSAFDTEYGWDFVRITDGNTGEILSDVSGTTPPAVTTSSFLVVRFSSDSIITRPGWQAAWTTPNQAPTVAITSPAAGSTVTGATTVAATAADGDGAIAAVRFDIPGLGLVEDTAAPYEVAWDTLGLEDGSYTITATSVDDFGLESAAVSVTVTVFNPPPVDVTLRFRNITATPTSNNINPSFNLINNDVEPIALSDLEVRYWYTVEGTQAETSIIDWAGRMPQGTNISRHVQPSLQTTTLGGQTRYVRYLFAAAAGSLQQHEAVQLDSRFNKSDWSNYNQTNDYSYSASSQFIEWERVTVYYRGQLVWGVEPGIEP
jgi:subtilisin family serine protease